MKLLRFALLALSFANVPGIAASTEPAEREHNAWPVRVQQVDHTGRVDSWMGAGPFLFQNASTDTGTVSGFRPFWVQTKNPGGNFRAGFFLYPIFSYSVDEDTYRWSIVDLIRRTDRRAGAPAPNSAFQPRGEFEVWPFWFSRQTGDPELSYRALFPIAGTLKNKLGFERLSWTLFPLYVQSEKRGAVTTSTPWPILRVTRGAAHGFGVWPLFTWQERPGVSREEYYLWPLGYNVTRQPSPDDPPGAPARRSVGALPFYARSTGPGYASEDFVWPFFGYTDRTAPLRYHETRYLWPFLVQGRGDERFVNRWGPFYTHSIVKGYDKQWFGWPLVRHARWTEENTARTRTQFFYFLYWSEVQHSVARPENTPAGLTHLWPLFSNWDNGAGRRQWQLFSPLEVFFPGNEKVRNAWTPFFAIARYDRRAPGEDRTSLLWNAITWQRSASAARTEFHLGPLLSVETDGPAKRVAIGNGLIGWKRQPVGAAWRLVWLDFPSKRANVTVTTAP